MIHAASHFYHEKRVPWVSIYMHACDPVPIIMGLPLAALRIKMVGYRPRIFSVFQFRCGRHLSIYCKWPTFNHFTCNFTLGQEHIMNYVSMLATGTLIPCYKEIEENLFNRFSSLSLTESRKRTNFKPVSVMQWTSTISYTIQILPDGGTIF